MEDYEDNEDDGGQLDVEESHVWEYFFHPASQILYLSIGSISVKFVRINTVFQ